MLSVLLKDCLMRVIIEIKYDHKDWSLSSLVNT